VTSRAALCALAALALALVAAAAALSARLGPRSEDAAETVFEVRRGDSLRAVAERLEAEGLVRDGRVATWWAWLRGQAGELRAGEYLLSPAMSAGEILDRIAAGKVATWEVVIPEGLTAAEIGARLAARGLVDPEEFAAAVADPELARELGIPAPTLEGYLFPETYRLPRGLSGAEVARILVEHFQQTWSQLEPEAEKRGLAMHEVVILASIVEKETGAASERPLIASVFANRLRRNMRLESDPTVIYGISDFDGNLRRSHLDDTANNYNTYQHYGLPPGPIANPGLASLRAVVEPADTNYLYFVSRNDGTHYFSPTYREHVDAVDRYQRQRVAE
jgi:peptidoglycan lytic transglycosylase G